MEETRKHFNFKTSTPRPLTWSAASLASIPQGPHSDILMMGGGGLRQWFIKLFPYPKKIPTSEFVYPKKSLHFLAYPKKSLHFLAYTKKSYTSSKLHLSYCWFELMKSIIPGKKNPCVFFATPKNPCVFHRPKKTILVKISDPKKSLGARWSMWVWDQYVDLPATC